MTKRLLPLIALISLAAACGDDDKSSDSASSTPGDSTVADTTPAETTPPADAIDPATVKVYTSEEVCTLATLEVASETLGVEVTEVGPFDMSTPQCSYDFTTADGVSSNLTLAVQRPIEDLGGAAGMAGFEVTTSLVIFDTPYEPIDGVGDAAAVSASPTFAILAVLANNQVFTIATSAPIGVESLVAFAVAVAANV